MLNQLQTWITTKNSVLVFEVRNQETKKLLITDRRFTVEFQAHEFEDTFLLSDDTATTYAFTANELLSAYRAGVVYI